MTTSSASEMNTWKEQDSVPGWFRRAAILAVTTMPSMVQGHADGAIKGSEARVDGQWHSECGVVLLSALRLALLRSL